MTLGSTSLEAVARNRAANFYTFFALFRTRKDAIAAWQRVQGALDLDRPLGKGAAAALGRFDIDDAMIERTSQAMARDMRALREDDRVLELATPGYPELLAAIPDPPPFIFVRGRQELLSSPGIAVVGTRHPSAEGATRARKLAYLLARRGITVFSGLAMGIDRNAHVGALEAGGSTVAVVGTPITKFYPAENEQLQERISQVGAVVSQFRPGSATTRASFPIRNATMSGLALGTVVVEASETSGALIQARRCLEQNRRLFIPQSAIENKNITWPRKFAERGAIIFRTVDDLVGALESANLVPSTSQTEPELAGVGGVNAV